ncbi:acyl-CoA dehydrogenase family protein [Mycolicibacterium vaccae]|uniref:Acyl-CoA dehydrogenase type 2 domain-containing protein n=1 Tax=Mycolicibacterium vaccae ATCC 25954 TaxID=1194972 RepID=K0UPH8_MYCVA|nr:acyl-CoA dehydrogenase family protein [Mycolicibacterium vaccae]ANI40003.1 acyl-CoA dehydrogenase [Mycolicibacterium vaccae 95051]EJZ09042.1 acyl-CoA dehydrogenase type 2 domain-containing protein [Mycolicibacterium vaccae ATCC 25954]MCV7063360.1 acyl-CoA/acyl-ACP dehydrogenase [Mycolicibacterium vaccae]
MTLSARQVREAVAARAAADWDAGFQPQNFTDLRASGLPALTVPRQLGGPGAGIAEASAAVREIAAGDAATGLVLAMHYIHTTRLFTSSTSDALPKLAARILADGELVALVASEQLSGAPSRGAPIKTVATRRDDGGWRITGSKTYATGARAAGSIVIVASFADGPGKGHFLVPQPADGLTVLETWDAAGLRGSDSQDLRLDDVCVDPGALVETVGADGPVDATQPIWWPLMLASVHLGVAEAARAEAIAFAAGPRTDGRPGALKDTTRIRDRAAAAELEYLSARALLDDALRRVPDRDITAAQAGAVKVLVHRHATAVVDHCGQLIGAASMRLSSPLQRHYRDLRVALHNPPAEDTVLAWLATEVLGPTENQE